MIDNFHYVTAAKSVLGNVPGKSSISVEFKAHGSLFLRD